MAKGEAQEQPANDRTPNKVHCPDCAGNGTRIEPRACLPAGSRELVSRFVPVRCRSCKGKGNFRL